MKQITQKEYLKQLNAWSAHHMKQHGCSREKAHSWAEWNALNPPGPEGSACEKVKVILINF